MKKKVWISLMAIVLLLVVAWLGASWYTGKRVEAEINDRIRIFNTLLARNPKLYSNEQVRLIGYERGLFSSHARYAVTADLPLPVRQPGAQLAEIDTTIWHGPFPLEALRQGDFWPQKKRQHTELLMTFGMVKMTLGALTGGKPLMVMDTRCTYGQHCIVTGSVPPINMDLGMGAKGKLSFGGIQIRMDVTRHSNTDYAGQVTLQLLPLSIQEQDFGRGQITFTLNGASYGGQLLWKTGPDESTINAAYTLTQPLLSDLSVNGAQASPPQIKTLSLDLSLSKPMLVNLIARLSSLAQNTDPASAKQQANQKIDAWLSRNPDLLTQGDLLVSHWQYADDKLTVNGQNHPEWLARLQESFRTLAPLQTSNGASPAASDPGKAASGQ